MPDTVRALVGRTDTLGLQPRPAEPGLQFSGPNSSRQSRFANNVELVLHTALCLLAEAQFRALRYFTLAGTDHPDHATQARLIRRHIHWRNRNTDNPRLKRLINTANVAWHSTSF